VNLLLLAAGVAVGVVLGALGGGGAVLTVPVLVYGLGMPAHTATTASLVVVGTAALVSAVPHARDGRVRWGQGLVFGLLGTLGTAVGSWLSRDLDPDLLLLGFAGLLLVIAVLMWRRAGADEPPVAGPTTSGLDGPGVPADRPRARPGLVVATATGVGLLTGVFGVGGGFAIVPALVMALGFPMGAAVGTSLVVIAVNSATALTGRLATGVQLDWPVVLAFTALAVAGGLLGSRVTGRVRPSTLQRAFAALLVAVATYMAVRSGARVLG
jgi:uncharacterized membrane protein YfcA